MPTPLCNHVEGDLKNLGVRAVNPSHAAVVDLDVSFR